MNGNSAFRVIVEAGGVPVRVVVDELVARVGTDGHYGVANGVLGFPSTVEGP